MSSPVESLVNNEYKYGFVTDIEADGARGLSEDIIRLISAKKGEPDWLLEWRLKALPGLAQDDGAARWANVHYEPIDYQDIIYYSAPKTTKAAGQPGRSRSRSCSRPTTSSASRCRSRRCWPAWPSTRSSTRVSVGTTYKAELAEARDHLLLLRRGGAGASRAGAEVSRLGGADSDNFFAALNSAVFSDGSFVYIPKGVRARWSSRPTSASTRPRRASSSGRSSSPTRARSELPRGLHGAEARRRTSCTPRSWSWWRSTMRRSSTRPSRTGTPATNEGGRHLQLRDQARQVRRRTRKISWTQVETGSAITWKYPSVILQGDDSVGEFYSVA